MDNIEMKNNKPFRPILPPKKGYVEVADENGEHVYQPTEETLEQQSKDERMAELEKENKRLEAKAKANTEQINFLENCLLEMADEVYA